MKGTVIAVCISERKGVKKHPVPSVTVKEHHGIIGDAHAGDWHRQISLLADESVDKMREKGAVLQRVISPRISSQKVSISKICPSVHI